MGAKEMKPKEMAKAGSLCTLDKETKNLDKVLDWSSKLKK